MGSVTIGTIRHPAPSAGQAIAPRARHPGRAGLLFNFMNNRAALLMGTANVGTIHGRPDFASRQTTARLGARFLIPPRGPLSWRYSGSAAGT
jgi:hypothetical protein